MIMFSLLRAVRGYVCKFVGHEHTRIVVVEEWPELTKEQRDEYQSPVLQIDTFFGGWRYGGYRVDLLAKKCPSLLMSWIAFSAVLTFHYIGVSSFTRSETTNEHCT